MKNEIRTIDTGKYELLLVTIPEDLRFYLNQFGVTGFSNMAGIGSAKYIKNIHIENIKEYSIVGKLCNIDDSQMKELVPDLSQEYAEVEDERTMAVTRVSGLVSYKNYTGKSVLTTPWQSFASCIRHHGFLLEEPVKPQFSALDLLSPCVDTDGPILKYQRDVKRWINPLTTLILKRKSHKNETN